MQDDLNVVELQWDTPAKELSPAQRQALRAIANQQGITAYPYYSTIKWTAPAVAVAPGASYTIPAGMQLDAFSYGRGQLGTNAGFVAADGNATLAETNIQKPRETTSGDCVYIYGVAIMLKPGSIPAATAAGLTDARFLDSRLLAQLATSVSIELGLNGDQNRYPLGTLQQIPGAGGLTGTGYDSLGTQAIEGGRPTFGFVSNGWPVGSNYFRMPEGLRWMPSGCQDSMLSVIFTATRAMVLRSGGDPENPAATEAAVAQAATIAGVRGYTIPTSIQNLWTVFLRGTVISKRTLSK